MKIRNNKIKSHRNKKSNPDKKTRLDQPIQAKEDLNKNDRMGLELLLNGGNHINPVKSNAVIDLSDRLGDTSEKQDHKKPKKIIYEKELRKLQIDLVKLQEWVKKEKARIVVLFEGRDAAGKGGVIKRITEMLNPRVCKVVALGIPTEKEKTQWYFQRYVEHLPSAGEMVLFDRSWYNRACVEHVMGFCTQEEYNEFLRSCPEFEQMLIRSGIILIKYWFSISDEEQERRFSERIQNPMKRWKFSPMDLLSRKKWEKYSQAKDEMFKYTDTRQSPWFVVEGDDKKKARLNCMAHLLSKIPYVYEPEPPIKLPKLKKDSSYKRSPWNEQTFVPEIY
jgi:polyphosphate kinase 2